MGLFGGSSKSASSADDSRGIAYDSGIVASGKNSRVNTARDFANAVSGRGNTATFEILDGGAIEKAFDFASASLDKSHEQISGFAAQAGQFLEKSVQAEADQKNPATEKMRLLLWPLAALAAFWIWKKAR